MPFLNDYSSQHNSILDTYQYTSMTTNSTDPGSYSVIGNILVWGLIIGTLLSYTPQYYKIYKSRTTKGISESTIVFGVYSCVFNVLGTIQQDYKRLHNCKINNDCYNTWIPIVQLVAPLLCIVILYWFYLSNVAGEYTLLIRNLPEKKMIEIYFKRLAIYKRGRYNLISCALLLLITLIVNTLTSEQSINNCGKVFNIISAFFSIIMWLPQIIKTYSLRSDHSLSLIALAIHSLGCFITVFYQGVIMHQNFLVIGNYIIGGISEGLIVCMVLYFRRRNRKLQNELERLKKSFIDEPIYTHSDEQHMEPSIYAVTL